MCVCVCVCRWWQLPYYYMGIKCYDLVAGRQLLKSSYVLSKSKALELFPMLKRDKLVGALVYYDGRMESKVIAREVSGAQSHPAVVPPMMGRMELRSLVHKVILQWFPQ